VRGNHEQMALDALSGAGSQMWRRNGGDWFYSMKGLPVLEVKRNLLRCHELPLILHLQLAERVAIIAHADYPAEEYAWGKEIDTEAVLWGRERVAAAQRGKGARIRGADDFYFGHTPLPAPLNAWNQHYIDTGAVFGNNLTLVQVQ
jgi:serine/threonine protein phosphatase 1